MQYPLSFGLAAILLLLTSNAAEPETAKGDHAFRAGATRSNITPPLGSLIIGGWKPMPATHIHDHLWVRCIVLDDGEMGLEIRRRNPFETIFTISHPGRASRYLPTESQHAFGGCETSLEPNLGQKLGAAKIADQLLERLNSPSKYHPLCGLYRKLPVPRIAETNQPQTTFQVANAPPYTPLNRGIVSGSHGSLGNTSPL